MQSHISVERSVATAEACGSSEQSGRDFRLERLRSVLPCGAVGLVVIRVSGNERLVGRERAVGWL